MTDLIAEKLGQVVEILQEQALDCWMIFVRETTDAGDPVLPLVLGHNLTWQSALLLHRDGRRVAIVGKFEDETVAAGGLWTDVIPYVQSIREPLLDTLRKLAPKTIAVNYSRDDVQADGLSHGMFLVLQDHLAGTPYADALVPADGIIAALRGRKAPAEVDRIRAAIAATDEVFDELRAFARPGRSEVEIAQFMRAQALARQCEPAWDTRQCPLVTSGPGSMIGHGLPSETLQIEPGRVFHVDFGVRKDGYCSDLQRVWYVPENGQTTPPEGVQQAFETVRKAIEAAGEAASARS